MPNYIDYQQISGYNQQTRLKGQEYFDKNGVFYGCYQGMQVAHDDLDKQNKIIEIKDAILSGNKPVINRIIQENPDFKTKVTNDLSNNVQETILSYVIRNSMFDIIEFLLEKDVPIDSRAFVTAAYIGNLHIVKILLSKQPEIIDQQHNGKSALHAAAEKGHLHIVKFLSTENPKLVNQCTSFYNIETTATPLAYALSDYHKDVVEYLLENGADVNSVCYKIFNEGEKPVEMKPAEFLTIVTTTKNKSEHDKIAIYKLLAKKGSELSSKIMEKIQDSEKKYL